jgi:hypothetical protein
MSALEALILVRRNKCRVTFGDEVVVEAYVDSCGSTCGGQHHTYEWREVGRGLTFVAAAQRAKEACGWTL